jgi:hypothetical protein
MDKYQCCFCGKTIEKISPDVCSIIFSTDFEDGKSSYDQQLWCHAICFKNLLHPSAHLYVLDLAQERIARLKKK